MGPDDDAELHTAARSGDLFNIKRLLGQNVDVNIRRPDQSTPLMVAAMSNQIEAVALLIERGADINAENEGGETALSWATHTHRDPAAVLRLLLENGAIVNHQCKLGFTALMSAAFSDHIEGAEVLIEHGADLSLVNESGLTALAIVQIYGETEEMQAVLRRS